MEQINEVEILDPYGFIYMTTNNINGKKYIGQSTFNRITNWVNYLGSGVHLKRSIKKYGKENFSREIIAIAYSKDELNQLEIEFIKNHNAVESDDYYNLVGGGNTNVGFHFHLSEESRKKISIAKTGVKKTEETKRRMSESKKIGFKNGNLPKIIKVICITTEEIFDSITYGADKYNIKISGIIRCCQKERKSAGKHPTTKERLVWMYLDEYNSKSCTSSIINFYKIICLTTGEIFNSLIEAEKTFNIFKGGVLKCCKNKIHSAGVHPDTKEKLVWMYYNEYILKTKDEINNIIINMNIDNRYKQVICLNTKEVFSSALEASIKYNIDNSAIIKCCKGKLKSTGKINNNKMIWMYYKDYIK